MSGPPDSSRRRPTPALRVAAMRARMWVGRHSRFAQRLGSFARALACSGGRRAWAGVALAGLDAAAEAIGDPWSALSGWQRWTEYGAMRGIVEAALGPTPEGDSPSTGDMAVLDGVLCLRTHDDMWTEDLGAMLDGLRERLWAALGPRVEAGLGEDDGKMWLYLRPMPAATRRTAQGAALVRRLRPFAERGRGASCLLVGEPGCGKTTAAAEAVEALGAGRSLRVPVGDLARMRGSTFALLRLMRPEVLVVDDLDRHGNPDELLALFDEAGQHARLRIATCNYPRRLGSALLRPGRFDLHVRATDAEVLEARAGDARTCLAPVAAALPSDVLGLVQAWPIAYVAALADRLAVLGPEAWSRELDELRRRLDEQREMAAREEEEAARSARGGS